MNNIDEFLPNSQWNDDLKIIKVLQHFMNCDDLIEMLITHLRHIFSNTDYFVSNSVYENEKQMIVSKIAHILRQNCNLIPLFAENKKKIIEVFAKYCANKQKLLRHINFYFVESLANAVSFELLMQIDEDGTNNES
jgi:hypothetical protein